MDNCYFDKVFNRFSREINENLEEIGKQLRELNKHLENQDRISAENVLVNKTMLKITERIENIALNERQNTERSGGQDGSTDGQAAILEKEGL